MENKVVLDTHCSIETPRGYLPGLPLAILAKFKVSQLVYITGLPHEIHARRNADASRARPGSVESIAAHNEYNKMLLATYSVVTGAPAKMIMNSQGKVEEAQREFVSLLE
jgi:adenylate kinase